MKRPLAVLTIPLAVLGFVACGDDDDDTGTTTATTATTVGGTEPQETTVETTGDTTGESGTGLTLPDEITLPSLPDITLPGGGTLPSLPSISLPDVSDIEEQIKEQFVQLGMSDEQAECLVDKIDLSSGEMPDLSSIMDLLGECDINLGDLNPDG